MVKCHINKNVSSSSYVCVHCRPGTEKDSLAFLHTRAHCRQPCRGMLRHAVTSLPTQHLERLSIRFAATIIKGISILFSLVDKWSPLPTDAYNTGSGVFLVLRVMGKERDRRELVSLTIQKTAVWHWYFTLTFYGIVDLVSTFRATAK